MDASPLFAEFICNSCAEPQNMTKRRNGVSPTINSPSPADRHFFRVGHFAAADVWSVIANW